MSKSLIEATKTELINKSKNAGTYKNTAFGKNRWERKKRSSILALNNNFNRLDMNQFFKHDILEVKLPIAGETDNYEVVIKFSGVLTELKKYLKNNKYIFDYKLIVQALIKTYNSTDVYVKCNCHDFQYRFDHWSIVNHYGVNETSQDPGPGKGIANPNDDLGIGCKHILLVLDNRSWIMPLAITLKNYIYRAEKDIPIAFEKVIFPKLYGMTLDDLKTNKIVPENFNTKKTDKIIERLNDSIKNNEVKQAEKETEKEE